MGKVNVYLPDDLERRVRDAGIPVSSVCQAALRAAVEELASLRTAAGLGEPAHVTPRLREILATGPVTALELLGAVILHGENLGARVLADLGVELPTPRARARRRGESAPSPEVREVLAAAYRAALELGHNYLGAEHVVIALARDDAPTASLFAALALDERAVRQRVVHLLSNPWRADAPGPPARTDERLARFERELQRMTAELQELRSSAKLGPWPPTTSS